MPGPVVHNIIAEQLPKAFARHGQQQETQQLSGVLRNNRREMTYGSQGPDPFFFNPSDLVGKDVAKRMLEWWTDITSVQQRLHQLFAPVRRVKNDLAQRLNQGVNTLTANCQPCQRIKDLIVRLRALSKLITTLVKKFIKKYVTTKGDIFGLYVSPKQTCDTHHRDWWWFDTLHYRKTGDFTANLLDIARGKRPGATGQGRKNRLLSYAVGYLSHFAADVVGHAYVNAMVGGPYRHHAQRHTTMEKFMDVWAYDHYYDNPSSYGHSLKSLNNNYSNRFYESSEVINSGMHKNQQFTAGRNPPQASQRNPNPLFQSSQQGNTASWTLKLPEEISLNFAEAVNGTYDEDQYGTFDPAEADISYRFWYLFFQMSTGTDRVRHPSDLPGNQPLNRTIQQEWNRFKQWAKNQFNNVNFGGGGGGNCQGFWSCLAAAAGSAWNFLKNLGKAIASGVKVLLALGQWIVNNLLSLPIEFLMWATQRLYEKAYVAYKNLLLTVGATGFGYVYSDQVRNTPQIQNMLDPTAQDHFNNTVRDLIVKPGRDDTGYPRKRLRTGPNWDKKVQGVMQGLENEAHLVVPFSSTETPRTVPGPDSYGLNTPDEFIDNPGLNLDPSAIPRTPQNRSDTRQLAFGPPRNPDDFRAKSVSSGRGMYAKPLLGDAVRLTVQLFDDYVSRDLKGRIPNLNMSGDRGLGYPTWANTTGSYNADSPKDDDEDLDRSTRRQNDPLQVEGCEWPSQQNWFRWTGTKNYKRYAWLEEPIDPVFEPDTSNERRY
jgi:hypothetical protein